MTDGSFVPTDRDWPEDSEHGLYMRHCSQCERTFIGHKRRYICKVCAKANETWWNGLTPEEKDAHSERVRQAWYDIAKKLDSEEQARQSKAC